MYTHSTLQDYPSISHLKHRVRENAISILFAVTKPQQEAYSLLSKNIDGAKVGHLTANSSNILELVEEQYKVNLISGLYQIRISFFLLALKPSQILTSSSFRGFVNDIQTGGRILYKNQSISRS